MTDAGVGDSRRRAQEIRVFHRNRWMDLMRDEDGLGLIEVMIAIFIMAVALMALASVGISSLTSLRVSRDREQATNGASAAIEEARRLDFADIALAPGSVTMADVPPGAWPSSGTTDDGCFGDERIHTDAVLSPIPFVRQVGNSGQTTVHTVVTHADTTGCSGNSDLRRVTAIASWTDGNTTRFVRQDTLIVAAGRGLPVPKFEVKPPDASLEVSKAFLLEAAPSTADGRRCVEHLLRNLGAEDSYDWELEVVDVGSVVDLADGFKGGGWEVTGYLEYAAEVTPEFRDGSPPSVAPMTRAGGVPRPSSDERVAPGNSALLTVCYEPVVAATDVDTGPWPQDVEATVAIRSRFDQRQERRVSHSVSVRDEAAIVTPGGPAGTPYYLFDWEDSIAHPRTQPKPGPPKQGDQVLLPLSMGPLAPLDSDPGLVNHLGEADFTVPGESNWSTDVLSGVPGTQLVQAPAAPNSGNRNLGASTSAWHRQFNAPRVLLAKSELVLWSAPQSALIGPSFPAEGKTVTLEVRVDRLKKNESADSVATVVYHEYEHLSPGWQRESIPIDFGSEFGFAKDQYLRLRITCSDVNDEDCNLAYDNVDYPTAYYIQVKS